MVEAPGTTVALTERATESGVALSLRDSIAVAHPTQARVAVLVVSYNGLVDLLECLESLVNAHGNDDSVHLVVFDNASSDGSPEAVERQFPQVTVLRSDKNLGYAGGGTAGWRWIQQNCPNAEYLCVLNQDTIVELNWLDALVDHLDQNPDVGLVQPMICLEPERHLINNLGLRCHYLGFAYQLNYRDRADSIPPTPREVDAVSGAAFIVRTSFLAQYGLFSDDLFMYLEDVELSWRIRMSGLKSVCVPKGVVFHKYSPDAIHKSYRQLERNRYLLVTAYYPLVAMLVLGPAFILMEMAQIAWALRNRLLLQRLSVWWDLLSSIASGQMTSWRRAIQSSNLGLTPTSLYLFCERLESFHFQSSWLFRAGNTVFAWLWRVERVLFAGTQSAIRPQVVQLGVPFSNSSPQKGMP